MVKPTESELFPHAMWKPDCCDKLDFDGDIIRLHSRYYPDHTAVAEIHLVLGPAANDDGGGEYLVWHRAMFAGPSKIAVQRDVEAWAKEKMQEITRRLGGLSAFKEWNEQ